MKLIEICLVNGNHIGHKGETFVVRGRERKFTKGSKVKIMTPYTWALLAPSVRNTHWSEYYVHEFSPRNGLVIGQTPPKQ